MHRNRSDRGPPVLRRPHRRVALPLRPFEDVTKRSYLAALPAPVAAGHASVTAKSLGLPAAFAGSRPFARRAAAPPMARRETWFLGARVAALIERHRPFDCAFASRSPGRGASRIRVKTGPRETRPPVNTETSYSTETMDANAQRAHSRNNGSTPATGAKTKAAPVAANEVRDWKAIDTNHDNLISPEEMEAWLSASRSPATKPIQ
jgi:hypothetical protein